MGTSVLILYLDEIIGEINTTSSQLFLLQFKLKMTSPFFKTYALRGLKNFNTL